MTDHPVEVDIIFIGGGTSACVAAGRLAAANPDLNIMLIEQGPNNFKEPSVYTPAFFLGHLAPDSKTALFWKTNKSDFLNGRESVIATGGLLGGGSSINFMMYNRPSASDFDDWKTSGWGSKDLIPLLQKLENYHIAPGRNETHGYNGPINVSYSDYYAKVAGEYLDVCVKRGIPFADDIMDLNTGHGCQRLGKYIDPVTGHRQDAAHRYIHPQHNNKRLHIVTQTLVSRILFDGTKAVGVEVIGNKNQVADADQTPRKILARKLVIVSAGAIGSAIVLQRSGVGEAARSAELGVDVVSDVPVGSNYEDHSSCLITYHVADENETMDIVMEQDPKVMEKYIAQYANGKGLLTTNGNDAGAKLRPTPEELKDMGPAFQDYWKRYFEPAPDKPVFVQTIINGFLGPRSVVEGHGSRFMMIGNIAAYPASRGSVYATSTDPYAPPNFRSGILDEQADVDAHIWMYKKSREILRRLPSYRGEFAPLHPKFPQGSPAACVRLDASPSADMEDHVYTPEDNAAIEQFVRDRSDTTWHSIGTIQMKPKEQGGCVDGRLNVYGTSNLKVADLSILPGNVGANTYATALMVGEKAALLIAEDLGVNLP